MNFIKMKINQYLVSHFWMLRKIKSLNYSKDKYLKSKFWSVFKRKIFQYLIYLVNKCKENSYKNLISKNLVEVLEKKIHHVLKFITVCSYVVIEEDLENS